MDIGMRSLHPAAADHSVSIRGSRCTALIILSLRSRAVVFTTALPDATRSFTSAGVTAQQRWSRRMTDELGSRQRDLSTSSVTKRANGHWHAIIASSCRWSQREYKRQPVHRINHPIASEPSGGVHYCSSWRYEKLHECGRYGTAAVVAVSRDNNGPWRQSHRSVRWPAPLRASALKEQISLKEYTGDRVFLKMSYHPCVSGCGRSLAPQDGHDHCLTCLGIQHAEEAFVDGSCSSCGDMTISELRNRLRCVKHGGVPLPLPRSGVRPGTKRVAMQLCPTVASTLRGEPCLPSRACKYSSGLTGSAYRACGEAASALHAMALLQVHQAKALRNLHEGGHDLAVLHELRAATDLALRATKVTTQSLGRAMSTLVVQERHLWLCLTDMKEQEKVQFLNAPVSQTGLFGDAVESCAQQFSAAQKQTEAIKHIMRRRKPAAASTPAAAPQPARRRGRPPVAAPAPTPRQQPSTVRRRGAGHRQDAQPVQAPARPGGKHKCKRPWDGRPRDGGNCSSGDGDRTTPSPGGGPGGESFVSFCFCSATGPAASGTQNFNKRAVSSVSGSQEEESGVPCITGSLPSSSRQAGGGCPRAPLLPICGTG